MTSLEELKRLAIDSPDWFESDIVKVAAVLPDLVRAVEALRQIAARAVLGEYEQIAQKALAPFVAEEKPNEHPYWDEVQAEFGTKVVPEVKP